jgi:hypothetical protein
VPPPGEARLWRGFTRPVWRDLAWWVALAASLVAMAPQLLLLGWRPDDGGWWVRVAVQGALTVVITTSIVGTGVGLTRGWELGLREGRQPRPPRRRG